MTVSEIGEPFEGKLDYKCIMNTLNVFLCQSKIQGCHHFRT